MDETRMFVKEVIIGRRLGEPRIDIKARGKFGFRRTCYSSIKIKVEEMSVGDFYKLFIQGKCPPSVGKVFRLGLFQGEADFEKVK